MECCLDFIICLLCGNVGICFGKLDNGDYDVIILVVVGLKCLGLELCICIVLLFDILFFVVGQGVVGIECCFDDVWM